MPKTGLWFLGTELETEVQLNKQPHWEARFAQVNGAHYQARLAAMRKISTHSNFRICLRQFHQPALRHIGTPKPLRVLDRLQLAAMGELKQRRLMTLDAAQAEEAEALGSPLMAGTRFA